MTLKQELELYRLLRSEYSSRDFTLYDVAAIINQKLADIFQIDIDLTYADQNGPYPITTSFNASTNANENKVFRNNLSTRIKPIRSFITSLKNDGYLIAKTVPGGQSSYHFVDTSESVDSKDFLPLFLFNRISTQLIPDETSFKTWFSDKTIEFEQDQFEITSADLSDRIAQRFTLPIYGPYRMFEPENKQVFNQLIHAFLTGKCQHCITALTSFDAYPIHFSFEQNGLFVYFKTAEGSILKYAFYAIDYCEEITDSAVLAASPFDSLDSLHPLIGVQALDYDSDLEPVAIAITSDLFQIWIALGLKSFEEFDFDSTEDDSVIMTFFNLDEHDTRFAQFIAQYIDGIVSISSETLKNTVKELLMNKLSHL